MRTLALPVRRGRAGRWSVVAAIVTMATACLPTPSPPNPPPSIDPGAQPACRPDPFTPEVTAFFNAWGGPHGVTAAAFDDRTGCWYHLNQGRPATTASVVKTEIMAGVLLRAQNAGRSLNPRERSLISPMMRDSANPPASALWGSLGAATGMDRVGRAFGLDATNETSPIWGLTTTTAEDQARFIHRLLQVGEPLNAASRAEAWRYLQDIRPDQRWGVRSGVSDDWSTGNKNGFAASQCCGWRANSVGYAADPDGGGYALAIFTDRWPNLAAGVPLVDAVATTVARSLAT